MIPEVIHGNCLDVMRDMVAEERRFSSVICDPPYELGFMNRSWDRAGVSFRPETWKLCLDLLEPGGMLAAFAGSRTQHRIACAIEDAGFQIFDCALWLHGQGFPKGKTQLKPAYEPIILARKPTKGPLRPLQIDACRVPTDGEVLTGGTGTVGKHEGWDRPYMHDGTKRENYRSTKGRWPSNILHSGDDEVLDAFAAFGERKVNKPSSRGEGGRNGIYGRRDAQKELPYYLDTGTVARFFPALPYSDDDLRFHYAAKAGKAERRGSKHPTVKPLSLMRWLVRLISPPGSTILDPFCGSGTTLQAAMLEGFAAVGIEQETEYAADARRRCGIELEAAG